MKSHIRQGWRLAVKHRYVILLIGIYELLWGFAIYRMADAFIRPLLLRYPDVTGDEMALRHFLLEAQFRLLKTDAALSCLWTLAALAAARMLVSPLINAGLYDSLCRTARSGGADDPPRGSRGAGRGTARGAGGGWLGAGSGPGRPLGNSGAAFPLGASGGAAGRLGSGGAGGGWLGAGGSARRSGAGGGADEDADGGTSFLRGIRRAWKPVALLYWLETAIALAPGIRLVPRSLESLLASLNAGPPSGGTLVYIAGWLVWWFIVHLLFLGLQFGAVSGYRAGPALAAALRRLLPAAAVTAAMALVGAGLGLASATASFLWAGLLALVLHQLSHLVRTFVKVWTAGAQVSAWRTDKES